jgi:hypothetical protein
MEDIALFIEHEFHFRLIAPDAAVSASFLTDDICWGYLGVLGALRTARRACHTASKVFISATRRTPKKEE